MYQGLVNHTRPSRPGGYGFRGSSPIRTSIPGAARPKHYGRIWSSGDVSTVMKPFSVWP